MPRGEVIAKVILLGAVSALASLGVAVTGLGALVVPVTVGGGALTVGYGAVVVRKLVRQEATDRVIESLAPVLGWRRLDRRLVTVSRWRGWCSHPRRVRIRQAPDGDVAGVLPGEITTVLGKHFDVSYILIQQKPRRSLLVFAPGEHEVAGPEDRGESVIASRLGKGATVTRENSGDQEAFTFTYDPESLKLVSSERWRAAFERAVSTLLPGRWRVTWDLEHDRGRVTLRSELPTVVAHPSVGDLEGSALYRIPYGRDEDGNAVVWDLAGSSPHLLAAGRTGSGKTVAINGIIAEICHRGWPVWIGDPKRVEFIGMRDYPNVQIVATAVEELVALIYRAHGEMERRYALVETGEADESDFEPLLVVLDEYRMLFARIGTWYAGVKVRGMPAKCPALELVSDIARAGRTARVHVILGTQRPDAQFLTGEMRDNFDARLALGRLSRDGAEMMWEDSYTGVSVPRKIRGRGTAVGINDRPTELQTYWTPDPRRLGRGPVSAAEDQAILDGLRPTGEPLQRLQFEFDEDLRSGDLDAEIEASPWQAVITARMVPASTDAQLPQGGAEGVDADVDVSVRSRPESASAPDAAAGLDDEPHSDLVDEDEELDDYGDSVALPPSSIRPGDLVQIDESLDMWGVVEGVTEDFDDPDAFSIDLRHDDGGGQEMTVPADEQLHVRQPLTDTLEGES